MKLSWVEFEMEQVSEQAGDNRARNNNVGQPEGEDDNAKNEAPNPVLTSEVLL
jgi:hypothetical protein